MFRFNNRFVLILLLSCFVCAGNVYAQKKSGSGSKYSSGSKSSFGGGSKYSSPSSSNKSGTSSSKYSSPSSSNKPSTGSGGSSTNKYSSPSSSKPTTSSNSKIQANQAASSQRTYVQTKKATLPPKSSYKTPDGKDVKVRVDSSHVQTIRNKPSTYYTPTVRQERVTTHIVHHNYPHDYGWYQSQPNYYIGGGYSSAFWWMMMDWSAERRANWLYHNRHSIESDAYQRGLQDAAVAARIQQLESENVARNADYIDPELADDPSIMYSQEYIEAAYNPTVASPNGGSLLTILLVVVIIVVIGISAYLVLTKIRFGS